MFALPSDTENSDTDQDDGAYEELNELRYNDMIDSSEPRSASTRHAAHQQSSADIPAMQDDAVSFSSDSDGTSDDDYSRNDIVVDGNDVWCSKTDQFGTLPEFDDEHACSDVLFDNKSIECDYLRSLFNADTMQNIVDQTNLYAQQERSKYVRRAGRKFRESGQTKTGAL